MVRKLAIFSLSFAAAVCIAVYTWPSFWLWTAGVFGVLLCLLLRRRGRSRRLRAVMLSIAGFALGLLWTGVYVQVALQPAQALDQRTVRLTGTVEQWPQETAYGWTVQVQAEGAGGSRIRSLLYLDKQGEQLRPGDHIETVARCVLASHTFSGEGTDSYFARGIFLWASAYGTLRVERPAAIPLNLLPAVLAQHLKGGIAAAFPADAAPLVTALVTGDRSMLQDVDAQALRRAGLSHTVAVSGMHLAFLAGLLHLLLGHGRRRKALATLAAVVLFAAMTGGTPSVLRAAVMLAMLEIAPLLERECDPPTSLSAALLLLLLQNPFAAASVGLQLSFAAVAGIMLFSSRMQHRLLSLQNIRLTGAAAWPLRLLAASLATTFGAMIFTVPLTALHFQSVSLVSPCSNLLALWAVGAAFSSGLVAGAAGAVFPAAGAVLAAPALLCVRYLRQLILWLSRLPFASVTTNSFYYRGWLVFVYVLLAVTLMNPQKKRLILSACACAVTLAASLLFHTLSFEAGGMSVAVLDVGQGQSVLIRAGDTLALVDCGGDGPDSAGEVAANYIQDLGRSQLDLLVITHYHADHANGVLDLLERISVSAIALPDVEEDSPLRAGILEQVEQRQIPVQWIRRAVHLPMGRGAELTLYPPMGYGETNELGLTALASAGEFDALLTGDMGAEVERILVRTVQLPRVELMVVGHHGSDTSTSLQLLQAVQPELAVISVGAHNAYGHPEPAVLERLRAAGAEVYRTDEMGTVTIRAN